MPNWCYNSMTVEGPKEDLDKFVQAVQVPADQRTDDGVEYITSVDLTLLLPTPSDLMLESVLWASEPEDEDERAHRDRLTAQYEENTAKYGHADWYSWNIANWSTKWAPAIQEFERNNDTTLFVRYDTAWGPATNLIRTISEQFPTLVFSVVETEESNAFVGCEVFHNGVLYEEGYDLDSLHGEEMPEQFREEWREATNAVMEAMVPTGDSDADSDRYWDAYTRRDDIVYRLADYCETIANAKLHAVKA